MHYWADLQSVHGLRCYDSAEREMSVNACIHSVSGYLLNLSFFPNFVKLCSDLGL